MAVLWHIIFGSFALALVSSSPDGFNRAVNNVDSCETVCEKSHGTHIGDSEYLVECCKRGCRFFSILSFIHDDRDVNATVADCAANCDEAYNATGEEGACLLGCRSQRQKTRHTELESKQNEEPALHVLYPLLYMHSVYSNMLDKVHHHMEVSWSVFTQADSGQMVVIRSEPQIIDFVASDMEDIPDSLPWLDDKTSSYMETNIAGQDNSATPLLNFRASQMRSARVNDDGMRLDVDTKQDAGRSDWLTCVAKKTGIARIVLCILILSTAIVMIWFCLSAATTAPEQHLSINGDLEYLRAMGEKDRFKLLMPQDRVEARPLPIKIKVEQI